MMEELKTPNGLTIIRTDLKDGGFNVGLVEPNGEVFALILFDDLWDQWQWKDSHNTHIAYLIELADEEYAEHKLECQQWSATREPDWQRVVDKYGGDKC